MHTLLRFKSSATRQSLVCCVYVKFNYFIYICINYYYALNVCA